MEWVKDHPGGTVALILAFLLLSLWLAAKGKNPDQNAAYTVTAASLGQGAQPAMPQSYGQDLTQRRMTGNR